MSIKINAAGWWFSPGIPVFSTNKTCHHDITEILLKVALNTITLKINMVYVKSWLLKKIIKKINNINICVILQK